MTIFGTGSELIAQIYCDIAQPYFDFTQTCQVFALDKLNQISRVRVSWGDGTANNLTLPSVNGIFRPNHKYGATGTYPVNLTVTTTRGEVKSASTSLTLLKYTPVVADVQCTANNLLVSCNALASWDINGSPLTYIFDYGDSFIENNQTGVSSHNYTNAGSYNVSVIVKNNADETASAFTTVFVSAPINQRPIASLNCFSNSPFEVKCNSIGSYDIDGSISSYTYDWGDGTVTKTASEDEVFHIYEKAGSVNIKVIVADNDGETNSMERTLEILDNRPPQVDLYCYSLKPYELECNAYAYAGEGNDSIVEYIWDFGDTTSEKTLIPYSSHTYFISGNYEISVSVKDQFGAMAMT